MTMNLKEAIHRAQTYQDLFPIARQLCASLSPWGCQYATVTDQSALYKGTITIGSIAEKAMKIRQRMEQNVVKFTPEEKENVILLSREISRLYGEDTVNCERANKVTNLCRLVISLIFWVNHQSKWNNRNGPSYKEQLQQPLSISLKTAINKAQNYQELLAVSNEVHAGLSWWGYQYAYVPTSLSIDKEVIYTGRIAIGSIAEKAVKIKREMEKNQKRFTMNEANSVYPFFRKIYCLYTEDKNLCKQANKLTTICRLFFTQVIFWATHQHRWGEVWAHEHYETYTDIIYKGLEWRALKGEITNEFIKNILDWEKQGATFIPYPDGT